MRHESVTTVGARGVTIGDLLASTIARLLLAQASAWAT